MPGRLKIIWNPEPLEFIVYSKSACKHGNREPNDFRREVMDILEARLSVVPAEEALSAPSRQRKNCSNSILTKRDRGAEGGE